MSSVRLEFIKDDAEPEFKVYLDRTMPAALQGFLSCEKYDRFSHYLNRLMKDATDDLATKSRRFLSILFLSYLTLFAWMGVYIIVMTDELYSMQFFNLVLAVASIASIILVFMIGRLGCCCDDHAFLKMSVRKMRRACERMSENTPNVTFHLGLSSTTPRLYCCNVTHIDVSVSQMAALLPARASNETKVNLTDEQANEDEKPPIVFARAISGRNYQGVAASDDDINNMEGGTEFV